MKRLLTILMLCTFVLTTMAQVKLTPQAQLKIAQHKARAEKVSHGKTMAPAKQTMRLVVKVAEQNARETYAQLREAGATIQGKIGQQAIISIPVDQVDALNKIEGVVRIDNGHKGKRKTDVTRRETGINLINGTSATIETPYTGRGVTVCVFDGGIDFQHPAFKDADGNSRIKCVFLIGDYNGNKFTIDDPEAGTIEFPGSVYDTPELIATLTTDAPNEYHGTHTAGIAAGSLTPMGFGGMAPEADIVFIGINEEVDEEELAEYIDDENDVMELVLAFATAYAQKSGQPLVFSGSLNSHSGRHNGTGTVPEAIQAASNTIIPVFSAGNEGGYPIHLYRQFTENSSSFKTLLALVQDDNGDYVITDDAVGYTRCGDRVSVKVSLLTVNQFSGRLREVWSSEECVATLGGETQYITLNDGDDATLSSYFSGEVDLIACDNGDGTLSITTYTDGTFKSLCLFMLTVSGSAGTEIDMWDNLGGFNIFEFPGYVIGDSEMSAGDWTCIPGVISVGAYCANTEYRSYDGSSLEDEEEEEYTLNDYAWFSSYGTSFNDITQPVVSAPGVNVVSSWSHYCLSPSETVLDEMQWQGYPYGAESGTSMACPVVSGIVACWLQANPNLTLEDVKEVIRQSSVNDDFTAHDPIRWGYGKINAAQGIEYILSHSDLRGIQATPESHADEIFDLQGRRVNTPTHGIYVKGGRMYFVK
ncbi:MAG: S8 family serine peptidase [Bacteroidales bacterium]|nr:S8 family serine peptidase [Bacteroidales bacterium]